MDPSRPQTQGLLAFGDSITNGGGELQWGVALQSWAQWVARGLGMPFTNYAVDGARATDVVNRQIPAHQRLNAAPDARYALGCLYIGVNDVRRFDWDRQRYDEDLVTALTYLQQRCDRLLLVMLPLRLGRPRAGSKVTEANTIIERQAAVAGALLLDLTAFGARNLLMFDQVHPTAFGQIAIAERALDVLGDAGMDVRLRPSTTVSYETSWPRRLQGDWTYVYRRLKLERQILLMRLRAHR